MNKALIGILSVLLVLLVACAPAKVPEEKVAEQVMEKKAEIITIGAIVPLTGDGAAYGLPMQQVTEIAREEINAAGGINGKMLEIIYEDGKCSAKEGSTAAQKLINVDKVKVILGGLCSGETLGAAPIAEEYKVILFSAASGSPDITAAGDYIFRNFPSDATSGSKIAAYANAKYPKVALLVETTDYAQAIAGVFRKAYSGEIIADEKYASEETDFKTQLTKIRGKRPNAVYIVPQTPQKFGILLKQKKELGMASIPLLTNEFAAAEDILKEYSAEIEGAVYAEPAFNPDTQAAQALFDKIKAKHGELSGALPPFYFATMYDAVYIMKEALTQSEQPDDIKASLYAIKGRESVAGSLTIDENGDPVLEYVLRTIKGGKPMELK